MTTNYYQLFRMFLKETDEKRKAELVEQMKAAKVGLRKVNINKKLKGALRSSVKGDRL